MISNQLQALRIKHGLSQSELANKLFVSRQSISKWENDQNYPSIDYLIRLAQIFSISIDELLKDELSNKCIASGLKKVGGDD